MRRRYVQIDGKLIEVSPDYLQELPESAPMIMTDLPGYQSPTTGLWVEGRVQRREDLKRSGCRPWEGREQEMKEANRRQSYDEAKRETALDRAAHEVYYQFPPSKRDILKRT